MKISFLASHGGTTARHIIDAIRAGTLAAEVGVVITNNRESSIFRWCEANGVDVVHISGRTHEHEARKDQAITGTLVQTSTDLVVLSGYMKKIGAQMLASYADRILNIHPSLLPRHGGAGLYGDRVHAAVLASGDRQSGASVHLVTSQYDEGRVLRRMTVPVYDTDSVALLRERVKAVEGPLYIDALREILAGGAGSRDVFSD